MEISRGQSAAVVGALRVNGDELRLAQVGPTFCIVRDSIPHAPSTARLVISVDGREETTDVYLPDGISAHSREVRYEVRCIDEVTAMELKD